MNKTIFFEASIYSLNLPQSDSFLHKLQDRYDLQNPVDLM